MELSMWDMKFLFLDDGKTLLGAELGWHSFVENQFNIQPILRAFGIPGVCRKAGKESVGASARRVTKVPSGLFFRSGDHDIPHSMLIYRPNIRAVDLAEPEGRGRFLDAVLHMRTYRGWKLYAAWDDRSFLLATSIVDDPRVKALHEAMLKKDALIFMGPQAPQGGGCSLFIIIASTLTKEQCDALESDDRQFLDSVK